MASQNGKLEAATPFKAWLSASRLTYAEFGARPRINLCAMTIARYANGERIPDRATGRAIFIETNGEVDPNSFYGVGPDLLAEREAA